MKQQLISKTGILSKCQKFVDNWAFDFLESTDGTGELVKYFETERLNTIRDDFYQWYVVGPDGDLYSHFKTELKYITDEEKDELVNEVTVLYNKAVERLLPNFILAN